MENPIVLQINKGLEIGYKRRCIAKLNDDLRFRRGEISLLLGSNGQGKTTLMKTLSGLLPAVAGHVKKVRTMFVSDEVEFPACLTPLEIVSCFDPAGDYCDLARELIDSLELQNKCYGVLSKGNRQKAAKDCKGTKRLDSARGTCASILRGRHYGHRRNAAGLALFA